MNVLAEHVAFHEPNVLFCLALVAFILAAIDVVRSGFSALTSWAAALVAAALVISWWPT